jgi:hypothetical protein
VKRFLGTSVAVEYCAELKMDGVSVELIYEEGDLSPGPWGMVSWGKRHQNRKPQNPFLWPFARPETAVSPAWKCGRSVSPSAPSGIQPQAQGFSSQTPRNAAADPPPAGLSITAQRPPDTFYSVKS